MSGSQWLLPELVIGRKTPAPKQKHHPRNPKLRKIPQEVVRAMRAEYNALPTDAKGHKPRGCYAILADKYGLGRQYTYNLLTMGLRDDERERK